MDKNLLPIVFMDMSLKYAMSTIFNQLISISKMSPCNLLVFYKLFVTGNLDFIYVQIAELLSK